MRKSGYETLEAATGNDAISILKTRETVDAVVLDLQMPGMSGLELLEHIRDSSLLRKLPVVICSSSGTRETVLKARQLNVIDFLLKPVDASSLRRALAEALPGALKTLADVPETLQRLDLGRNEYNSLLGEFVTQLESVLADLETERDVAIATSVGAARGAAQSLGAERVARALLALLTEADSDESKRLEDELRREMVLLQEVIEGS